MEPWRQELYHHGIRGQRWGVRKGPPYPLDAGDHTAAEKKAGWRRSLGEMSKRVAKRLKRDDSPPKRKTALKPESVETPKSEKPKKRRKPMSDKTKKILATTVTVAAIGVIGAVAYSNPKVRALAKSGMEAANTALRNVTADPYAIKKGDSDFDIQYKRHMKAMAAEDRRNERARKRSLQRERRAQMKRNDEFMRNLRRQAEQAENERRKKAMQETIKKVKLQAGINKMLVEDRIQDVLQRKYRNMTSAELLALAKRSRYTR